MFCPSPRPRGSAGFDVRAFKDERLVRRSRLRRGKSLRDRDNQQPRRGSGSYTEVVATAAGPVWLAAAAATRAPESPAGRR